MTRRPKPPKVPNKGVYGNTHWIPPSGVVPLLGTDQALLLVLVRGEQPARWEPQEEGVMSIAAGFPSVKKPRFIILGEKGQTTEGDAC
jgi:hypothetical protein